MARTHPARHGPRWPLGGAVLAVAAALAACGSTATATARPSGPPATSAASTVAPDTATATATSTATSGAAASAAPTSTPAPTPLSSLTVASVAAVVQRAYPAASGGGTAGCATGFCPFTSRLSRQLTHLASQTPSPVHGGDICNFDMKTGTQEGVPTPVRPVVRISGGSAQAVVYGAGQANPFVTLTVVDSGGTAVVDDIVYALTNRSVYSLSCTGSLGN